MIDHVSIAVRDLTASGAFYDAVLETLGMRRLIERPTEIGYGKDYPEFWLNGRPGMAAVEAGSGAHVCLRARSVEAVAAFHAAALTAGGVDDGAPGPRPEYHHRYHAAFALDPDGNRIEAVTFVPEG